MLSPVIYNIEFEGNIRMALRVVFDLLGSPDVLQIVEGQGPVPGDMKRMIERTSN